MVKWLIPVCETLVLAMSLGLILSSIVHRLIIIVKQPKCKETNLIINSYPKQNSGNGMYLILR